MHTTFLTQELRDENERPKHCNYSIKFDIVKEKKLKLYDFNENAFKDTPVTVKGPQNEELNKGNIQMGILDRSKKFKPDKSLTLDLQSNKNLVYQD